MSAQIDPESARLAEDMQRLANWKRWGPYLAERQWGTVREDYSNDGDCWNYLTHDHSRSRAYRWGEDGLLGITDRECRLCFALALWNGKDSILKERLFGLTGPEGNNGEDVKECYFYLESLPTHSYMKALYRYPQGEFPYAQLTTENRSRKRGQPEFELLDTGLFDDNQYFDILVEYAKASPNDIGIQITVSNRAAHPAPIHILPSLWFRNTWSWGRTGEGYTARPSLALDGDGLIVSDHPTLGRFYLTIDGSSIPEGVTPIFTENETNYERLFKSKNIVPHVKDAFHEYVIRGDHSAINPKLEGTKGAFHLAYMLPAHAERVIRLRLYSNETPPTHPFGDSFDDLLTERRRDLETFYATKIPAHATTEQSIIMRQAYAGLLWSKQFYYYSVREWLEGDPSQPTPSPKRKTIRNTEWEHLYNRDVISMPDKWEYPWYAAWDLAFHMVPFARIDPDFAKRQLILLLREWYMHPNGQIPAYEFAFSDVNPPVHAWAAWRVYKISAVRGKRDRNFLARVFQKLLLNFTWWVNRKDLKGQNLFSGGFLGLDNIGVFDRSAPLPTGGHLEQADGTAWMAFYSVTMLSIALELAEHDQCFGDMASKFFEHYVAITDAMNRLGGTGLWDEQDGFYYDQLHMGHDAIPLRVRSLVGLIPILAVEILEDHKIDKLKGFKKRMNWFLSHRKDLAEHVGFQSNESDEFYGHYLLALPRRDRLERICKYLFDEKEFLSPHGIRSLSLVHQDHPYIFRVGTEDYRVDYSPGESTTTFFGGNSNWRGPVWFPVNYLIIEALERYHHFYGDSFVVEYPTGSGRHMNLKQVANDLATRLSTLFTPDENGYRACHGEDPRFATDPLWKNLLLFHEYFHGDNGRGLGASHQTGWTALVVRCLEKTLSPTITKVHHSK
jgi:hypothetical protein